MPGFNLTLDPEPVQVRRLEVLTSVFWIERQGAAWRDLHDDFGKWDSDYRQFRRWTLSGVWDVMLQVLNDTSVGHDSV